MTPAKQTVPSTGSVTWSVLGLLVVPLLSVGTAAMLGETASATDQSRLEWGLVALLAGVGSGLVAVRLTRVAAMVLVTGVAAILVRGVTSLAWYAPAAAIRHHVAPALVPVEANRRASIRRRGPPVDLG